MRESSLLCVHSLSLSPCKSSRVLCQDSGKNIFNIYKLLHYLQHEQVVMLRFAAGEPELPTVPTRGPAQATFPRWRSCPPQLLKAAESSYKDGFLVAPCVWTDGCAVRGLAKGCSEDPNLRQEMIPVHRDGIPFPAEAGTKFRLPCPLRQCQSLLSEVCPGSWWRSQLCPQQPLPHTIRVSASGTATVDASLLQPKGNTSHLQWPLQAQVRDSQSLQVGHSQQLCPEP